MRPVHPPVPATRLKPMVAAALTCGLALGLLPAAHAALKPGDKAPDFSTEAALGGQVSTFSLAEALRKGPVVVYFYPKAFTSGCTVEAHEFAEATPRFAAVGTTVIGLSNDNIGTLKKFSVEECRNKFAVGADPDAKIIKAWDAKLMMVPGMAARISYLVGQDGKVVATHEDMDAAGHVGAMLKAAEGLRKK